MLTIGLIKRNAVFKNNLHVTINTFNGDQKKKKDEVNEA